ncbi:MAG: hypothetical protein IKD62_04350, partial [Oscillospiraceae bacterium]|nr:hypothetical protein [Oscillospiraceae bacterium]
MERSLYNSEGLTADKDGRAFKAALSDPVYAGSSGQRFVIQGERTGGGIDRQDEGSPFVEEGLIGATCVQDAEGSVG